MNRALARRARSLRSSPHDRDFISERDEDSDGALRGI